jgi:pimeloyl-ACP methyl ester carboxylesterase
MHYDSTRAIEPTDAGYVERDGVRTFYEVYGDGDPTILFLPTWSLVHSRVWRNQIAYFARHYRVVLFDGRGNGRSDRPSEPGAYQVPEFMLDALAVLDATGTDRVVSVSLSAGTAWNILLAAWHPDRVSAAVFVGPTLYAVAEPFPDWATTPFNERFASYDGFEGQNRYFIGEHYHDFVDYWSRMCSPEPHSTRAIEFAVGMSHDTTPEVVLATLDGTGMDSASCPADRLAGAGELLRPIAATVQCPVLVVQGGLEQVSMPHWAEALAEDTGGELLVVPDAGHHPGGRKPARFNLALRAFVERVSR